MTEQIMWAVKDANGKYLTAANSQGECWHNCGCMNADDERQLQGEDYRCVRVTVREVEL